MNVVLTSYIQSTEMAELKKNNTKNSNAPEKIVFPLLTLTWYQIVVG